MSASNYPALVLAVREHASIHYEDDGWDYVIEAMDEEDIEDIILDADAETEAEAIKAVGNVCRTNREREWEIPRGW